MIKKFFALFLCLLYFTFANAGFAFAGNLYFVKNSNKENIKSSIVSILQDKNYTLKQQDPYYALSSRNSGDYIIIILQPSSNNYFYYYKTNGDNNVDKQVLKALKKMNVEYEQSYNSQYLTMFENQAQKIYLNTADKYSFDQPRTIKVQSQAPQSQVSYVDNNTLHGSVVQVAKGAKFKAYLQTPLNTATAAVGDEVRGVLSENWTYNGKVIAQQGSLLTGAVSKARHATYGSLNGKVVFSFNKLITPDGKTYDITTDKVDFTVSNEGKFAKSAGTVIAGAAAGLLVGLLIGVCSKDTSTLKAAAISAGIGAGAGAIEATAERGIDAEIPVYTQIEVALLAPFSAVSSY